ncbi:hypothetical protein RNJ44_04221 [Nakaseomyces bracarensis]|uniref:MICOS complex subunit MIC19 n=1 Tax=Nakaseomyces bracarensis TaxID=273131 RepID=A0ABR4NUA7_9SACH
MGVYASKQTDPVAPTLFTPQSKIEFSQALLSQLEDVSELEYSRKEYAEKAIEQKISTRLAELEVETLRKFKDTLNDSLKPDSEEKSDGLSSKELSTKLQDLQSKLESFKKLEQDKKEKFELDNKDGARSKLTECLLKNKGKPLNCIEEISEFKKFMENK